MSGTNAAVTVTDVTTYSLPRHWRAGPGKNVGIGLGHMGIKLAQAMDADQRLGADATVLWKDPAQRPPDQPHP